jgi:hypothetical protein
MQLYHTDEFQQTSSFREQIYLAVDYVRTDGVSISFGEIAILFGVAKGAIVRRYQRQKVGPYLLNPTLGMLSVISCLADLGQISCRNQ